MTGIRSQADDAIQTYGGNGVAAGRGTELANVPHRVVVDEQSELPDARALWHGISGIFEVFEGLMIRHIATSVFLAATLLMPLHAHAQADPKFEAWLGRGTGRGAHERDQRGDTGARARGCRAYPPRDRAGPQPARIHDHLLPVPGPDRQPDAGEGRPRADRKTPRHPGESGCRIRRAAALHRGAVGYRDQLRAVYRRVPGDRLSRDARL